ncbi:MAG: hypothetical protein J0M02_00020 [Planctomycetes bacterium]|nr:hypothetical protein [Planctomycetota bacterium]
MPSLLASCAGLSLALGLASVLAAAEPSAAVAAVHYHQRDVPTYSKVGHATRSVACTETHPAPPTGPEHTHRWFTSGDKRPGQWITETCTQIHPEPMICPAPAPKGGCAHKPRC